jgi:hypothetical protein
MSGNYGQNNKTLNVDTLFVRDIYFRDFANNPIPANLPFVSRGDGGTYFTSSFASTIALPAINAITASTVTGPYQFAPIGVFNTFSLNPGAGMEFYSNAQDGGLIIYNIGPEQIIADGQVLPFTILPDYTVGGRTLQYIGTGDTYLQVSDATIFFNSVYNSSISTVLFLQSTTIGLEYQLNSSISILNSLITSTGLYNYNLISSYFLTPNVINISTVSTSLLVLGDNYIEDTPLRDSVYDPCIVYTGSTILSTNTDFLTFNDIFSGVTFAIDKEFLFGSSTLKYGPSTTTVTRGQQVQLGWFPTLSTQTNTQSLRAQFVPVVQQIQVLEQLVSTGSYLGGGLYSTTTNYYMKNIGRFDEICNPTKISLISPVIAATLRYDNTVNNSWIQYDTATSSIVWGNNGGGSGTLPSTAQNYGDYLYWDGTAWEVGLSTISIGDQAGGGFVTGEGQGEAAIAIGAAAGYSTQGAYAVAMGYTAGQYGQMETAVAIGNAAGNSNQGSNTVAIGNYAGGTAQGDLGIAIGNYAGYSNQKRAGVAIGYYAGQFEQGSNAVAMGIFAGNSNQNSNSVAIGNEAGKLFQGVFGTAIGYLAGFSTQGPYGVAMGAGAGGLSQGSAAVAIGVASGQNNQGSNAVAIGASAGQNNQGSNAVAIGVAAGQTNQESNSIAIGAGAGQNDQSTCTIVLNATGFALNTIQASSFYVAPIRYDSTVTTSFLQYNTTTKEVVWNTGTSTMTQSLIPNVDNAYDIGTSTLRLRHLYVGPSSLTIGTGSISADNGGNLYARNAAGNTITIGSGTLATDNFCIALGYGPNYIAYSYDGINWTGTQTQVFPNGIGICAAWNGSLWVAGGSDNSTTSYTLASSPDGIRWTSLSGESPFNTECTCIAWNGSIWVAGGEANNTLAYSRDGIHWTGLGTSAFDIAGQCIAWNGTIWVAGGQTTVGSLIQYSYDGITWTSSAYPPNPDYIIECVAWNGSMWVAGGAAPFGFGNFAIMLYSFDGINWSSATAPFNYNVYSVAWNGFMWVAGGNQGAADPFFVTAYSYNGINWALGDLSIGSVKSVTWNGSIWIAGGGELAYSYNGINWFSLGNTVFPAGTNVQGVVSRNVLPYVGSSPIPFTRMSTIAYGTGAGGVGQGLNAVAIGYYAGLSSQGVYSIAVGAGAGLTYQGSNAVAVGVTAGTNFQSTNAVAIGAAAGQDYQGPNSVAVGIAAGLTYQGSNAVAIGAFAGQINQGSNAIAIGFSAGANNQSNASIVINATGQTLDTVQLSSFYVAPIRNSTGNTNALTYNVATGEIIYDTTKTFVINHPKDESKYLVHACLEGPEAGVYYRGTGTIADLESSVIVELPDYVDALAVDITVQVTPIYNGAVRVLNASCVSNNKFTVYGDSGDFWWHVYGRRAAVVVEPKKSDVAVLGTGPYRWIA